MTRRSMIGAALAITITLVAAIALYVAVPHTVVWLRAPLGSVALACGLVLVGGWSLVEWMSRTRRDAYQRGENAGISAERAARTRFLSRLDHELKNPVTAIRAAIASVPADQAPPALNVADLQSSRLAHLVAELRKLSELEIQPIETEDVDLTQVIQDAVDDLTARVSATGDHRAISLGLPTAPWPLPRVRGDADLLYLAVHNLLSNAVKYSPPGSAIEVRASDEDGLVILDVADVGIGIPADELDTVMDELARGRDAAGIPGSGLGLSLVRTIAMRHGGSICLRSRPGAGTSARLTIPSIPERGPHHEPAGDQ